MTKFSFFAAIALIVTAVLAPSGSAAAIPSNWQMVEVDQTTEVKGALPVRPSTPLHNPAGLRQVPFAPLGQNYGGEVEPNGTFATASPFGGTDLVTRATLFPNGDVDFYSFTAAAGDRVYAATMTSSSAGSSTDSQLTLLASDGTTIIEFDDDNGSLAGLSSSIAGATIPTAGTYFLKVNDFAVGTASERPYELHFRLQSGSPTPEVEANDTPATANVLPANGWVSGARDPAAAAEQDWYSITLNAGDTVYLGLDLDPERDGVFWNGRLGFGLFGDAANQILVVDDIGAVETTTIPSESFFLTVKTAGTYFAFVDSATAATGGPTATYNLSVSVRPASNEGVNCTTYTSTNVPQTIGPGAGLVSSTITVPGNPRIADIDVDIVLNHAQMGDIDAHLRSPAGNDNGLFTDIGSAATGGQNLMDVVFDDEAGSTPVFTVLKGLHVKPELAYRLNWFDGENAGGTWTLDLRDDGANLSGGTLTSWSMRICEAPPPPACAVGFVPQTVLTTDFEAGAAGFTHSGTADEWALGLPATAATSTANPVAGFTTCNSGANCWKTDLLGTYNISSTQDLLSPNINLAGLSAPVVVSWAQRHQMESASFDHAFVDAQQAGGATPVRLWEWIYATMTDAPGNPAVNVPASSGWGNYSARADSLAGLNSELRFHVDSDTTINFGGLAIDDVTVTACRALSADLSISKGDGVVNAVPGGSVTYTIVATNAAGDPVTGATVADTFPAVQSCNWTCAGALGGTCTAAGAGNINDTVDLPAGASVTYTAICTIAAAAIGTIANTATVASAIVDPVPGNNSATDTDNLVPTADISVSKTDGLATASPGQTLNYTIVVSNAGPSNDPAANVTDTAPTVCSSFTWTCSGAGGGTCSAAGSGNINDLANLPAGGSASYLAACVIAGATTNGTVINNTAAGAASAGVTDPTPANNSATDTTTVQTQADLSLTKTDGVTTVAPGQTLNYVIVASNAGPQATAGGDSVNDTFPVECSSVTWTCGGTGGGTCTAAGSGNLADAINLPVGATVTYSAACVVGVATPNATVISNTASVAIGGSVVDPNPGNNSATDTTTVAGTPDITGTKVATGSFVPGGAIAYTIVLNNVGASAQNDNPGNEFDDVLPTGISYVSSTASTGTITFAAGTVSWNGSIAAGGSVTLTINATINSNASGNIVNQGTIHFDADANGSNETNRVTDNPAVAGAVDPTGFTVITSVPTIGRIGLIVLSLMLLGFGLHRRYA